MSIPSDLTGLAGRYPEKIVFRENDKALTAQELLSGAGGVSSVLAAMGIPEGSNIGILLHRGVAASQAIYGVLLAACAYVPIDPAGPEQRIRFILQDAQCNVLIYSGDEPPCLSESGIPSINIDTITVEQTGELKPTQPEQTAALLYTSGSTGTPKGVAISHRAISAFAQWGRETFCVNAKDRIASLAPYQFDLSLFDLFTAPLTGATTIYMPDRLKLSPARLVDWLIEQKITSWYTVPSILAFVTMRGGLGDKSLPDLRQILYAGEVFPVALLRQLCELLADTRFYNLFGPTETNVCLYWPVDRAQLSLDEPIPVGKAACKAEIKITDEHNELLIKGPCLMSGYWKSGVLALKLDSEGWFHTGDKVSLDENNDCVYHGRLDRMIKSSGYRIEPAEIEAALNSLDGVQGSAVVAVPDSISGTRIAAAVCAESIEQQAIRKQLQEKLPTYMQPAMYSFVETIPLLANGKTDYRNISSIFGENKKS